MNLGKMLDENAPGKRVTNASLADLRWLDSGSMKTPSEPFEVGGSVGKKNNNIKPELEVEWGYGGIAPLFTEQKSGIVDRNLPPELEEISNPVIIFARDQMNRGVMGKKLVASLRKKFTAEAIKASESGLRKQIALEGIVGCIAVDGRGYKNCKAALAVAQHSPHKKFIKHVIGCSCGTPHMIEENVGSQTFSAKVASTGNAADDFFASEDKHSKSMVTHCRSTAMTIIEARGDIDESEMDKTMIDVMSSVGLSASEVASIKAKETNNLKRVQAAFRRVNANQEKVEASKYQGKVDTAGFVIDTEDRPIDLVEAKVAKEQKVNLSRAKISFEEKKVEASVEIEGGTFIGAEFKGYDEITLDEVNTPVGDLDIDGRSDMSW
jgi:hypothetical protein